MSRSVLITGINGFIGTHVAEAFLRAGFTVGGTDLHPACRTPAVRYAECDLTDAAAAETALGDLDFDCVVHIAAILTMHSSETLRINETATYHMLRLAKAHGCGCFIHLSSIPVIGLPPTEGLITEATPAAPKTAYHVSKYAAELLTALPEFDGMRRYNLRIASPIGPGMPRSFLRVMLERALAGEALTVYGVGSRVQNYIDARDVASVMVSVAESAPAEGLYLLGGTSVSNLEAARKCAVSAGSVSKVVLSGLPDAADGERWLVDDAKARAAFGFVPRYTLERSLADLAEDIQGK